MIEVNSITKKYETVGTENVVLKNVSFEIQKGEFVLITGKSGSGKSTLLNILTGVDTPTSGTVSIKRKSIQNLDQESVAQWRGANLGIVFQFFQLIPTLTVLENILLPMDLVSRIPSSERVSRANYLLEMVGLAGHADKMPSMLSGGEQQRVAIARALANDVDLIVADEPTGNLDSQNALAVIELLRKLNQSGKTIVMVTHERECFSGATRKIMMMDGRIVEDVSLESGVEIIEKVI